MGKKKKRTDESEEDSEEETKKTNKKKKIKGAGKKHVIEKKKIKTKTKEKKPRKQRHETSHDSSQSGSPYSSIEDYKNAKKKKKKVTKINIDNKSDEKSSYERTERVSNNGAKDSDRDSQNRKTKLTCFKKFMWVYLTVIGVLIIIGIANFQYFIGGIQNSKIVGNVTTASKTSTVKPDPQKTPSGSTAVSGNSANGSTQNPKKEEKQEEKQEEEPEVDILEEKSTILAEEYGVASEKERLPEVTGKQGPVITVVPSIMQEDRYIYGGGGGAPPRSHVVEKSRVVESQPVVIVEHPPVVVVEHPPVVVEHPTNVEVTQISDAKQRAKAFIKSSRLGGNTMSDGKVVLARRKQDHIDEMNEMNALLFMSASAQPIMRSRNKKAPPSVSEDLNETTITHFRNETKVETIKNDENKNKNGKETEDVDEEKKEVIIPPEVTPLFEPITISLESDENPNYLYYCNIPPRHVTEKLIYQFFREQRKKKKILYFSTSIDFNEDAFKLKLLEEIAVGDTLKELTQDISSSEEASGLFSIFKKVLGSNIVQSAFVKGMITKVKNIVGLGSENRLKESPSKRISRLIKIILIFCVVQFIIVFFLCMCLKSILKMIIIGICKILICCCCGGRDKKKSVA